MKKLLSITTVAFLYLITTKSFSLENKEVCNTLLNVIDINTNAYKNCLLQKSGEKFSREELNTCKKYYLTQIERLSYVYKNICK
tara:strand:- start:323 stop:574 length:252 start_codon:yes stop_codon:yes gene_type:complete